MVVFLSLAKRICENFGKSSFSPLISITEIKSTSTINSSLIAPVDHFISIVAEILYNIPKITFKETGSQIRKTLKFLVTNKSTALDGIPPVVLKNALLNFP